MYKYYAQHHKLIVSIKVANSNNISLTSIDVSKSNYLKDLINIINSLFSNLIEIVIYINNLIRLMDIPFKRSMD
jgi:hypothetical protein